MPRLVALYPATRFCGGVFDAIAMVTGSLLEAMVAEALKAMRWVNDLRAKVVWASAMQRVIVGASGMPLDLSMQHEEGERRDRGRRKT